MVHCDFEFDTWHSSAEIVHVEILEEKCGFCFIATLNLAHGILQLKL